MRAGFLLACLLAAGTVWGAHTARVVRAHPWLTRGLERESLVGVRFLHDAEAGSVWGGGLKTITFSFRLEGCAKGDLSDFRLWRLPYTANYGFHEPIATRLDDGAVMTRSETGDASSTAFTVTFALRDAPADYGEPGWVFPSTPSRAESDALWLTATIAPTLSRDARIWVDVADATLTLNGCPFAVANGKARAPHRVYPQKFRINAYLRDDYMKGAGDRTSDILDDAPAKRLAGLTDIMFATLNIGYDASAKTFTIPIAGQYANAIRRAQTLREEHGADHVRIFASLGKGSYDASIGAFPLAWAARDANRAAFVQALVEMMEDHALDGLDIDWEYPNYNSASKPRPESEIGDFRRYGLLLRDLSEAFFDRGWELCVCVNDSGWGLPGWVNDNWGGAHQASEMGEIFAAADFVNSMAYGPWPTFLGNTCMTRSLNVCQRQWAIPARRILVGQAVYSNASVHFGYDQCRGWARTTHSDPFDRLDCDTLWMAWENPNLAEDNDRKRGDYRGYTGPTTFRAKCARVPRDEGSVYAGQTLGGVMTWGYYSDSPWEDPDRMSLGLAQWQTVWPRDYTLPTPPRADDGAYLLDSAEDWWWFQENPGCDVRLAADLTLDHDPLPIPSFSGTLDGAGHTITLPPNTWIVSVGDAALFRSLAGATIRDLTVRLEGRVVSLADRAGDTAVNKNAHSLAGDGRAALLATSMTSGTLENVTLVVAPGAEIQGAKQAAVAVANVYASGPLALRGVRIRIEGVVRANASNSAGTANTTLAHPCVGGLIGWLGNDPASPAATVADCSVTLAATARLANETGTGDGVAPVVGHLHYGEPTFANVDVRWASGAALQAVSSLAHSPMPWIASYWESDRPALAAATGRVIPSDAEAAAALRARWASYWMETLAPFGRPGFRLLLR